MLIDANNLVKYLNENLPELHFISGNSSNADASTYYVSIHEFNDSSLENYIVINKYNMTSFQNVVESITTAIQEYGRKCGLQIISPIELPKENSSFIHYVLGVKTARTNS